DDGDGRRGLLDREDHGGGGWRRDGGTRPGGFRVIDPPRPLTNIVPRPNPSPPPLSTRRDKRGNQSSIALRCPAGPGRPAHEARGAARCPGDPYGFLREPAGFVTAGGGIETRRRAAWRALRVVAALSARD